MVVVTRSHRRRLDRELGERREAAWQWVLYGLYAATVMVACTVLWYLEWLVPVLGLFAMTVMTLGVIGLVCCILWILVLSFLACGPVGPMVAIVWLILLKLGLRLLINI